MVLIPSETLAKLEGMQQQTLKTVQTPGTELTRLDHEMHRILNSDPKDEGAKWKMYQQVLQRFLRLTEEMRGHHLEKMETTDVEKPAEDPQDVADMENIVMESVPARYKVKARLLYKTLQNTPNNVFSWNDKGTVSINGKPIENSNVVDLVNEAMRARKTVKAVGREQFVSLLRSINVPREYIGNNEFWSLLSPERSTAYLEVPGTSGRQRLEDSPMPKSQHSSSDSESFVSGESDSAKKAWKTLRLGR